MLRLYLITFDDWYWFPDIGVSIESMTYHNP